MSEDAMGLKSCLQEVLAQLAAADGQAAAVFGEVDLSSTGDDGCIGGCLREGPHTVAELVREALSAARSVSKKVGLIHAAVCGDAADPLDHLLGLKAKGVNLADRELAATRSRKG